MSPRDRCLLVMEVKAMAARAWACAGNDHERLLLENILVTVNAYLREQCKALGLPWS